MTRAQTLGLMAATLWQSAKYVEELDAGREYRDAQLHSAAVTAVDMADALLREAERVSPEPERVQYYGPLDAKPPFANITVAPPQRPDPIHVPEKPR